MATTGVAPSGAGWGGGTEDSVPAVGDQPCRSRRPASAGVYPALPWLTGAMLHQSHLQQPPHESLQPERTCSNSWATRRMISLPAEWNKDKVTWNSAPGARNMASQQRAFRWPNRACDSLLQDQTGQRSFSLGRKEGRKVLQYTKNSFEVTFITKLVRQEGMIWHRVYKGLGFKQFSLHWLVLSPFFDSPSGIAYSKWSQREVWWCNLCTLCPAHGAELLWYCFKLACQTQLKDLVKLFSSWNKVLLPLLKN